MDQYSTALGDLIYLETKTKVFEKLPVIEGSFVLGDSGLAKATQDVLLNNKNRILEAVESVKKLKPRKLKKISPPCPYRICSIN